MTTPNDFDARAAWAKLTPEQQAELGAAAISYVVHTWAFDEAENEYVTDWAAKGSWDAEGRMIDLVATACPDARRAMVAAGEKDNA